MDAFLSKAGSGQKPEISKVGPVRDNTERKRQFSPSNRDSVVWANNLMKKVEMLNQEFEG